MVWVIFLHCLCFLLAGHGGLWFFIFQYVRDNICVGCLSLPGHYIYILHFYDPVWLLRMASVQPIMQKYRKNHAKLILCIIVWVCFKIKFTVLYSRGVNIVFQNVFC